MLLIALISVLPARANQYQLFNYYIQQMITSAVAANETGVQAFREQLEALPRPEGGDSALAKPMLRQGLEHLDHAQLKEALAAFRQAFITDPADPEAADQLGLSYLRLQRFPEAERLLVYTLALAPTRSLAWLHLGQTYGQTGDANRAAGAFINARRFATDPAAINAQLQQLAAGSPDAAVRSGAQQALTHAPGTKPAAAAPTPAAPTPAPAAAPTPAAPTPAPAAKPPAASESGPVPAPPPSPPAPAAKPPAAPTPAAPMPAPAAKPPAASESGPAPVPPPSRPTAAATVTDALRQGLKNYLAQAESVAGSTASGRPSDNPGQQVYQNSIARTCLIVSSRAGATTSLGSGLLVSADGLVITNNHVVGDADNLVVKCGQRESVARVRKRSLEPDLALLATSLQNADSFTLDATYNEELIGRDVFVIGNPYGLEGTFSTGVISGLRQIDGVRYIQISAPISAGNSGGPVILRDGSVIGVATMALKKGQNINFAIAAAELTRSALFDPTRMKVRPQRAKGE